MSKDKNLIIVIFLVFSFVVSSASFYFGMPKQSSDKDIKPTVLGITSTINVSSSAASSQQTSSAISQSWQQRSSSSQSPSSVSTQDQSSSITEQENPLNRGNWEEQQGAYSN